MIVRLDAHEALENFSNMITRVHDSGEIVMIKRADQPVAVIVPVELYERHTNMVREEQSKPAVLRETMPMYRIGDMTDDMFPLSVPLLTRTSTLEAKTLAGAFPELAHLCDEDIDWAKQQWQRGIDRQIDLFAEDTDGL
jgi:antitoxin (DNA-binding transcriptional repressor) of toxin-antitoxin stability system